MSGARLFTVGIVLIFSGCGAGPSVSAEESISPSNVPPSVVVTNGINSPQQRIDDYAKAVVSLRKVLEVSDGTHIQTMALLCGETDGALDDEDPRILCAASSVGESLPPVCLPPMIEIEQTPSILQAARDTSGFVTITGVKRTGILADVVVVTP